MEMQNMNDRVKVRGMNGAGFGIIQKSVMQNRKLHVTAKAIYAYFSSFVGGGNSCFPSRSKICYDLDISKDTLSKYLNNLISCGYLEIEQFKENGKFSHNVYTLCDPEWAPRKRENTVSGNSRHGGGTVGNRDTEKKITNYCQENTVSENTVSENTVSGNLDTKNNSYKNNNYKNNNKKKERKKERKDSSQKVESNKKGNLDSIQVSDSAVNGKKISDSKKSKTFDQLIDEYTNNEDLRKELKEHLKTRKLKKAALTDRGVKLSLKKLDDLASNDQEKIMIVQNAIMNGWISFYPLKKDEHNRLISSLSQHKPSYDIEAYESMNVFEDWDPDDDAKTESFDDDFS